MVKCNLKKTSNEILRERAEILAHKDVATLESFDQLSGTRDYLYVDISGERFAIEAGFVKEIRKIETLTPVPCTPNWMSGVVSVRGHILQVVDIGKYFGIISSEKGKHRHLIVVGNKEIQFCLLAEDVHDVRTLSDSMIARQPETGFAGAAYCLGITSDRVFVLKAEKLINDPGLEIDEEVVSVPGVKAGRF